MKDMEYHLNRFADERDGDEFVVALAESILGPDWGVWFDSYREPKRREWGARYMPGGEICNEVPGRPVFRAPTFAKLLKKVEKWAKRSGIKLREKHPDGANALLKDGGES